jgi:hypothetical protein
MKLSGVCPQCEQHVEWVAVGPDQFKCSNCWHLADKKTVEKGAELADALAKHEQEREKIFRDLL